MSPKSDVPPPYSLDCLSQCQPHAYTILPFLGLAELMESLFLIYSVWGTVLRGPSLKVPFLVSLKRS